MTDGGKGMGNRGITKLRCPECHERLLYDGKGLTCISCSYSWRPPESDKSIPAVRRNEEPEKKG